ncbi:CBS domain-containing protein [Oceanobacillus bengalensis]|nr:CBS domain-containing protein [Oceanobacillus bengalensis]
MIKEMMIKDVISVTKETKMRDLLRLFVQHEIGGVPVVDEHNRLIGMVADGDVIRHINPDGHMVHDMLDLVFVSEEKEFREKLNHCLNHPVSEVMKEKFIYTVRPEDQLEVALSIFAKQHIKKIPVVDENYIVVGVLSRGDIIRYLTKSVIIQNM